ncbi:MAG TPA: hypothetical protein VFG47_09670 [Geminicoccaceae bacterium]|nr:hypothetical protein [Geminicoccaceae bacterium]
MGPPDAPAAVPRRPPERLRVDLREGGKLAVSGVPPLTTGAVWEAVGPLVLAPPPPPAPELDLGPLAPPRWLRLSGTLEGSGAALELGAADPDLLPDWHGFSGPWQVGVDTRFAAGLDLAGPLAAGAARADYGVAVPLRGAYGPLALETPLVGLGRGADRAPHLRLPGETARLSYTAPDALALLGPGGALTLRAEASARPGGTEDDPLSVRSRLTWEPWPDEAATWLRSSAEVDFGTIEDGWRAGLSLRAEFDLDRDLLPGRHLHLMLEYRNEDLLAGRYGGDGAGGNQLAGVRLEF